MNRIAVQRNIPYRDTSPQRNIPYRDTSPQRNIPYRDTSPQRNIPYRDTSPQRNTAYRDTSPQRKIPPVTGMGPNQGHKPSRLEIMQAEYQQKILKQKEEKMIRMYEDNQQRALGKVGSQKNSPQPSIDNMTPKGLSAREFFQERRMIEQQGYQSPPIQVHYRQARRGYSSGGYSSAASSSSSSSMYSKNSAGRDRSNLLQPITQTSPMPVKTSPIPVKTAPMPVKTSPVPVRASQMPVKQSPMPVVRTSQMPIKQSPMPVRTSQMPIKQSPMLAKAKIVKQKPDNAPNPCDRFAKQQKRMSDVGNGSDTSPPPNLQTLRNFQKNKLGAPPVQRSENGGGQKLTDFQKWQLEQNQAREQRLDKHRSVREMSNSPQEEETQWEEEDEETSALQRKQQELMEEIAKQQAELNQIQQDRLQEETEAKETAEVEHKQAAKQEKQRRQKEIEEEKTRKREEEVLAKKAEQERRKEEQERKKEEQEKIKEEKAQRKVEQAERRVEQEKRREQEKERIRQVNEDRKQRLQKQQQPVQEPEEEEYTDYVLPDANVVFYAQAANDSEAYSSPVHLSPCGMCGRKFASERLSKHQAACKKVNKPRKVFDPKKQRVEGTEMAQYSGKPAKSVKQAKKNNWRTEHNNFIEAIRYAKKCSDMEAQGIKDIPPPPKTVNPNYVQCPTCNRNFNPATAEKHIPNCRARPRK